MQTQVTIYNGLNGIAYTLTTTNRGARYTLEDIESTPADTWYNIAYCLVSDYRRYSPWNLDRHPALERKLRAFARVISPNSRERVRRDNERADLAALIVEATGFNVVDVR